MKDHITDFLNYDPVTGVFTWAKKTGQRARIGSVAGSLMRNGYWRVKVARTTYLAHRLAWFMTYGEWPHMIDHINGKKDDNRIENLRLSDIAQNGWNHRGHKHTVRAKNVSFYGNRFIVRVNVRRKRIYGGAFSTIEEAVRAATELRNLHHGEFANHGNTEVQQ